VAGLLVAMNVGGWLGYVMYGYFSDRLGRRRSFVTYLIVASVLVFFYGRARSVPVLLVLGPVVAFFSTGLFSGFGAIVAELYPTGIRAAAGGFIFNIGRVGSAARAAAHRVARAAQRVWHRVRHHVRGAAAGRADVDLDSGNEGPGPSINTKREG